MNKVLNYLPKKSLIHELTGTTKLFLFLLLSFASVITYDTRVLLGLFVFCLICFKISKIKLAEVKTMVGFLFIFLIMNGIIIYLFNPNYGPDLYGTRHVLLHIAGRYDITTEQLFYQANIMFKYFIALPIAILFVSTTNPSELAASLNSIGIPYKAAYTVSLALRYIPDIQEDYHDISQAQQARGVELGKGVKVSRRLKNVINILFPLILTSINRIDLISNAMDLRCFGKNKKRTWYMKRKFARRDFIAIVVGIILFVLSMIITYSNGSRFFNPFI
ncbi:MAG: energy-coupling factor transporter transmembrane component T [Erysipelotrichaceae bacterium]|nr:energy-coupling factor transporter transmembrane component T [Erysipelotrichaceae bacterium]